MASFQAVEPRRLKPAVSVITAYYAAAPYIGRTVESLLAQSMPAWEQVIVDDGSPDDLASTLPAQLSDPRIKILRQANGGTCKARNAGVRACSPDSRYLLFLDDDDILEPEMLEALVGYLERNPDVGMAFCERKLVNDSGAPVEVYRDDVVRRYVAKGTGLRLLPVDDPDTPFESFFAYSIVTPSTAVLRRSVFEAVGGWDEDLGPLGEDDDLWLRMALHSRAHYIPRKLAQRRLYQKQFTRSPAVQERRRESARRFKRKWDIGSGLSDQERAQVAAARRFRDGRVIPYLWFAWSRERRRRGERGEAVKAWLRGCRLMLRASLSEPRLALQRRIARANRRRETEERAAI